MKIAPLFAPLNGLPNEITHAPTQIVFDAADDYERFMGRWSRPIAETFLTWLEPPAGARWLDVGCGTGEFSELILRRCTEAPGWGEGQRAIPLAPIHHRHAIDLDIEGPRP